MPDPAPFRRAMLRFHRDHGRMFPWRQSVDPYEVLVGEVLLQRTRGEHVLPVYREFLRRWPTLERLGRARQATIAEVIRPLGLAKRAQQMTRLGRTLAELGCVPGTPEELERLPGIGPYGAHAIPIFTHGRNLPLVDWVIARVLRRYFGQDDTRRPNADKALWNLAGQLAEPGRARQLWLGTLDFAGAVCRPRPLCGECPLRVSCSWPNPIVRRDEEPGCDSRAGVYRPGFSGDSVV
jgi:A/G-specific adenine glycosylase